jgi:putative FmdB family regulatory protein
MPIYEYECEKCNAVFEAMQSISAKPLKTCNKSSCKGKVHRLVSASGFIFKGSGWFTSEYPSDARKKGWESESKGATADANKNSKGDTTDANKNSKGDTTDANKNSTGDKSSDKVTPTPPVPATGEKAKTQPVSKKPSQKNPYSGSKKPRTKTST